MSNPPDDERVVLTESEAVARMAWIDDYSEPGKRAVHTILDAGIATIGAHMDEDQMLAALRRGHAELAGEAASAMGHGLVVLVDDEPPLFVETVQ